MSTVDIDLTYSQQRLLNILPRIGAAISMCCSLYLIYEVVSSSYYRTRIYHRIMAACAFNIILLNFTQIWGSAAVPASKDLLGANGTVETCSAQGFIFQFSVFVVPSYYVALSLLSYFSIRNKFQVKKYQHFEKWAHLVVYIFPLGSAIYLLSLDAYNHVVVGCALASEPIGCGDQSDYEIECTRGPQNIGQLQILFVAVPSVLIVLIPTIVMLVLYLQVRNRPGGKQVAKSVAKQSGLYLLVQYWTYLFRFLDAALILAVSKYVFATNLLANTIEALQGLWTLMVYLYFRSAPPPTSSTNAGECIEYGDGSQRKRIVCGGHNELSISFRNTRTKDCGGGSGRGSAAFEHSSSNANQQSKELSLMSGQSRSTSTATAKTAQVSFNRFSIFDGSNAVDSDSPWAAFLIDEGEDESYHHGSCDEYDDGHDFDIRSGELVLPELDHHNDDIATDDDSNDERNENDVRDSEMTVDTAPNSTRTADEADAENNNNNNNTIATPLR